MQDKTRVKKNFEAREFWNTEDRNLGYESFLLLNFCKLEKWKKSCGPLVREENGRKIKKT